MRRICQECGQLFGLKEPLEDDSETHGLCDECFKIVMAKTEQQLREISKKNEAILKDKKEGE